MKRRNLVIATSLVLLAAVGMYGVLATGNGAQSGAHYNLNLIGKDKTDILPNDANSGHRIFVNEYGRSDIYLQQGEFAVIDADATDGKGLFQLPAPNNIYDENGNYVGPGNYKVYVRELGKPHRDGLLTTCAEYYNETTLQIERVCSTGNVILFRDTGKPRFRDVTQQLTTITYYNTTLGKWVTVDIFDDDFQDYLWQYDNNGLKIVQLRFYPT